MKFTYYNLESSFSSFAGGQRHAKKAAALEPPQSNHLMVAPGDAHWDMRRTAAQLPIVSTNLDSRQQDRAFLCSLAAGFSGPAQIQTAAALSASNSNRALTLWRAISVYLGAMSTSIYC